MKSIIYLPFVCLFSLFIFSCSNEHDPEPAKVQIINLSGESGVAQGDTLKFKALISSETRSSFRWFVNGVPVEKSDLTFNFVSDETGLYLISLVCEDELGSVKADTSIEVYGKYRHGIWVLNEGNMTTENGSLVFISPKGVVTDSAYYRANGSFLGNVTQDLFIKDEKMYIISQNGSATFTNDGTLVVANSETLKRIAAYNDELAVLSWPTHVVVLDDKNIFIRDNKGVYLFNSESKTLDLVEGTSGAAKNQMVAAKGKVFVIAGNKLLILLPNNTRVSQSISMGATISGIVKAKDGNLFVSTTGSPAKITKIDTGAGGAIKANEVTQGSLSAGWGATPGITAKGDTLYYSGAGTKIYRHIFATGESHFLVDAATMVEDANIVYNNIAVHPKTGDVYLNTIKGYGNDFLINNISAFNFDGDTPVLKANYKDHTHFPAGIFFTDSFR
jgi:hypothetical protein